jgi:chromosome segregation ATPase
VAGQVAACEPRLRDYLLGPVAIVEHLDQAEALWRRNGVVALYVTPQGEMLGPTGRLRGGGPDAGAAQGSLLARKRQLRELEDEVRQQAAAVDVAQAAVADLGGRVAALRAEVETCEQSRSVRQAERMAAEKDLELVVREHERVDRHLETVRLEAGQVGHEAEETVTMLARLEQRLAAAREAEAAHEATMAALREAIEVAQQEEATLVADLTAGRVEVAAVAERVEALHRELGRIDQMEAELGERLEQARTRRGQLAERQAWLGEERQRTDAAARQVAQERDRAEAEVQAAAERHETLLSELRDVEQEARGLDGELSRLVGAAHELELRATERRVR